MAIGLIACNRFVIKAEAQKRIRDALSSLKSFSSYGKLVWFGFGIKPIIKDLAETEPGVACVALCACMSISYESFYVAEVLREFCKLQEAPPDIIPSIHQWEVLVRICAGAVSNSKFPNLLAGLRRLVPRPAGVLFYQPTSTEDLAKAIKTLVDVSNGMLANVTIAGGLDCMWLAAVSEWLLGLDVEIRLSSGDTMYRSSTNGNLYFPEVTIIFVSDNEQSIQLTKCHVVPNGHKFWGSPDMDKPRFRGGSSEWANILADTFGTHLNRLLKENLQHSFALLLLNASTLAEGCYRYGLMQRSAQPSSAEHSLPFRRFHFSHSSSRGQGFLKFAAKRLPELIENVHMLSHIDILTQTNASWKDAIDKIILECGCKRCRDEEVTYDDCPPQFCLELVAETIILFLWILSISEVDSCIGPSSDGLQLLYEIHRAKSHRVKDIQNRQAYWNHYRLAYFPTNDVDILTAASIIFSGSEKSGASIGKEPSALSDDGICVFFKAFEDLNLLPEEASMIRVVAGHINFEGVKYERIHDLVANVGTSKGDFGPHISYKLVVREAPQHGSLAAAYGISSNAHFYEYLVGISKLELVIAKSIQATIQCGASCSCSPLYQAREAIIFVPQFTSQRQKLSGELLPLAPQWSLVSVPKSGKDGQIKLQAMQAPIYRLYLEIIKQYADYHLTYLSLCADCLSGSSRSPGPSKETKWPPQELDHLSHSNSERRITVTLPSEFGPWINNYFDIFVIVRSACDEEETSAVDMQSSSSLLHKAVTAGQRGLVQLLIQGGAIVSSITGGETVLHCAAGKGHNEVVKILLARGAELDSRDENGQTPLSRAARNGLTNTVRLLIKYGAQQDSHDNCGKTPLVWAALQGHLAVVERLIQEKADVNAAAAGFGGRTALQAAAEEGHFAVVERLIQEKADVNAAAAAAGFNGRTALQAAAEEGHLAVVERLIREKADVNAAAAAGFNGRTALQAAAEGGHFAVVKRLIQEKADVNAAAAEYGKTALQAAAEEGHLAVVERLIREKADVNAAVAKSGKTALQAAAEKGHLAVVERLIREKADVNAAAAGSDGRTALQAAAERGHFAVVERLIQEKADVNAIAAAESGRTALQAAAKKGHLAVVKRLIQEKADVNAAAAAGFGGRTALQAAAEGGHLAVVERLIQEKADVNAAAAAESRKTALQVAAEKGHLAVVERLIREKADVNAAAGYNGKTALQAAAGGGHLAVVKRLIQEKADVNAAAAAEYGKTALQAAAEGGHLAVVERLIREKADVNAAAAAGFNGRTALQAAAEEGHLAVVERLIQEKVDVNAAAAGFSGRTALQAAAKSGYKKIVVCLHQAGAVN